MEVVTDHSAVKALLATPSPSGKHVRWWLQVYGSSLKKIDIVYRFGKQNERVDALSQNPVPADTSEPATLSAQIAEVYSDDTDIAQVLDAAPGQEPLSDFPVEPGMYRSQIW